MKVPNFIFSILTGISLIVVTVSAQQKSDREQDGLSGAVKTIVSKYTFVSEETREESKLIYIQTVEYDRQGKKIKETPLEGCDFCSIVKTKKDTAGRIIEEAFYGNDTEKSLSLRIVYTLDSKGKRISADYYNPDENLYRKWKYIYEYDSHGNWIKETAKMYDPKFFDGKAEFVPREVYYRSIKYY